MAFARQPIVTPAGDLAGYELLALERPAHAGALAALAAVDLVAVGGGADVFLDVTPSALLTLDPLPFGPEAVVLELGADARVDDDLHARLDALMGEGYRIAVDAITPATPGLDLLPYALFLKVDARSLDDPGFGPLLTRLQACGGTLVATDVQHREDVDTLSVFGFRLFEGPFHSRPSAVPEPPAAADLSRLRSAARIAAGGEPEELIEAISQDPGLSLRLLTFVNSAAIGLPQRVSSIPHAVRMLGPRVVRQWALLILVSGDSRRVSMPLLVTALARARTCENIASRMGMPEPDAYFLVGLLSVADALLDADIEAILADVPVTEDVRQALTARAGGKGRALSMATACETGMAEAAAIPGIEAGTLMALHAEALHWADTTVLGLAPATPAAA